MYSEVVHGLFHLVHFLCSQPSQISVEEYEEEDELSNNSANVYEEVHIPPSSSALDEIEKKAC